MAMAFVWRLQFDLHGIEQKQLQVEQRDDGEISVLPLGYGAV
jgi:hypothetical protein